MTPQAKLNTFTSETFLSEMLPKLLGSESPFCRRDAIYHSRSSEGIDNNRRAFQIPIKADKF